MKHVFRIFALMAVCLMGSVKSSAVQLVYDFTQARPSTEIRMDRGFTEVEGSYAFWKAPWSGFFGKEIAFDANSAYASLISSGGLCDYHKNQKVGILNLSVGDQVRFIYDGQDPLLTFHGWSSARLEGVVNNYDPILSDVSYKVTTGGNLWLVSNFIANSAYTVIRKIIIDKVKNYEVVDMSNGMATMYTTVPLDFSVITDVSAYVASDYADGKFTFTKAKFVPSLTGFLIVSENGFRGTAAIPVGRSSNYLLNVVGTNYFKGSLSSAKITLSENELYYIFAKSGDKVGLYQMVNDFVNKPNRAYLKVSQ